jgi:hypothetical protein
LICCHILGLCKLEYIPSDHGDVERVTWLTFKRVNLGLLALTVGFLGYMAAAVIYAMHPPAGILFLFVLSLATLAIGIYDRKEVVGKVAIVWAVFCLGVCTINIHMAFYFLKYAIF